MILRGYQTRLVDRAARALSTHGNTLAVAATGAGKTIMLAALAGQLGGKQLVLQHRQELVDQNSRKFRQVNPKSKIGFFTADVKSWRGDTTFAMAQTLINNLDSIPKLDLLILDEAHHAAAPTWKAIIRAVQEKHPNARIAGFTATPERADKKGLRGVFTNICDAVGMRELIAQGFLVPPRFFAINIGDTLEQLRSLGTQSDYFDQSAVEAILNTAPVNAEIVRNWKEHAADRRTVIFCSTVQHAQDVAEAFRSHGISAECVHGELSDTVRKDILIRFDQGKVQVVTNVMVLTEGFDSQPVSCVVLLRKCSSRSPLIQMIGRGLRTVNPEEHPGIIKKDCVILDFGASLLVHQDTLFKTDDVVPKDGTKRCPDSEKNCRYLFPDRDGKKGCGMMVPIYLSHCPACGFHFEERESQSPKQEAPRKPLETITLTEIDILNASPFRYTDLFNSGRAMMATGFSAWAGVFSADGDTWVALGKREDERRVHRLARTDRLPALAAADDFLREHETDRSASKSKSWLDQDATMKQIELLNRFGYGILPDVLGQSGWTKYHAACHAAFQFNRRGIETALGV